jgi:hypothetical protein
MYGGLLAYNYKSNLLTDVVRRLIIYGALLLSLSLSKIGYGSDTLIKYYTYSLLSFLSPIVALFHYRRQYTIS